MRATLRGWQEQANLLRPPRVTAEPAQVVSYRQTSSQELMDIQTGAKQLCNYLVRHWKADTLLLRKNLFVSTSVDRKKGHLNGSQSRTTRFRGEHEDTERELNGL